MASVEVIIRDDNGIISQKKGGKLPALTHANLDTIEMAVEDWHKQILPKLERQLLEQAQSEFTDGKYSAYGTLQRAFSTIF